MKIESLLIPLGIGGAIALYLRKKTSDVIEKINPISNTGWTGSSTLERLKQVGQDYSKPANFERTIVSAAIPVVGGKLYDALTNTLNKYESTKEKNRISQLRADRVSTAFKINTPSSRSIIQKETSPIINLTPKLKSVASSTGALNNKVKGTNMTSMSTSSYTPFALSRLSTIRI